MKYLQWLKLLYIPSPLLVVLLISNHQGALASGPSGRQVEQYKAEREYQAQTQPSTKFQDPDPDADAPRRQLNLNLSKQVLRDAIEAAKEPVVTVDLGHKNDFGNSGNARTERVDRMFKNAEIPTCMTMDAWKFDPPRLGPIPIPGFLAAPWLAHAIVTGKCRH